MAHSPMSRPDPSDPPEPDTAQPALEGGQEAGMYLSYLAATLSSTGGGALSADLALDLVLNEVVEQTRLATNATGAAIALAREGEIICRATTGANAPDLGVRLDAHSGLSGACVQTRQWQRCDDSETDPRVDAALCRRLGVRSILVFPVVKREKLLGVVEIFSSASKAFSDREIQTLQALSRTIVDNIERAAEVVAEPVPAQSRATQPANSEPPRSQTSPPAVSRVPETKPSPKKAPEISTAPKKAPEIGPAPKTSPEIAPSPENKRKDDKAPSPDYGMAFLTVAVIALALLLGWMIGRTGIQRARVRAKAAASSIPQTSQVPPLQPTILTATTAPVPPETKPSSPPETSSKKSEGDRTPADGLVVYDKGKVVFRMPPSPSASPGGTPVSSPAANENTTHGPQLVSPELANEYVTLRVEPEYPEQAREQHIQGPVVLEALVNKDGAVQKLSTVSGDALLAAAASDAVRQWRFKPYYRNGKAEEFQTQVTVSFRLP